MIDLVKIPLTYPLPPRDWFKTPEGLWASREWTLVRRKAAEAERYKLVDKRRLGL